MIICYEMYNVIGIFQSLYTVRRTLLERTTGVEPAFDGFAIRTLTVRDHSHMAGVMRFEHTQRGFGDRCSTN